MNTHTGTRNNCSEVFVLHKNAKMVYFICLWPKTMLVTIDLYSTGYPIKIGYY